MGFKDTGWPDEDFDIYMDLAKKIGSFNKAFSSSKNYFGEKNIVCGSMVYGGDFEKQLEDATDTLGDATDIAITRATKLQKYFKSKQ